MNPTAILPLLAPTLGVGGQLVGSLVQQRSQLQLARTQGYLDLASQGVGLLQEGVGLAKVCVELHHQRRTFEAQTRAQMHAESEQTKRHVANCQRDVDLFALADSPQERLLILQHIYGGRADF
jgi:hypothetical protein